MAATFRSSKHDQKLIIWLCMTMFDHVLKSGVENGLHWALDVIFREDKHRYQARVGAANLSLIRKITLGVLTRDTTVKKGRATKQIKAVASANYREHLLKNCI